MNKEYANIWQSYCNDQQVGESVLTEQSYDLEPVDQALDLLNDVMDKLREAKDASNQALSELRRVPGGEMISNRARSYWYGSMQELIGGDDSFRGSFTSLSETISEVEELSQATR